LEEEEDKKLQQLFLSNDKQVMIEGQLKFQYNH